MGVLLRLAETEPRTPLDHIDLMCHPVRDERVQAERARHIVDECEHVRGEVRLQVGVLVEVVQHYAGDRVTFEYDDQPAARTRRRVVAYVGDPLHLAGVGELGDLEREIVRVDLVRQLGDDQADPPLAVLFDVDDRAHRDRAATGAVGVLDALAPDDQTVGGEVGALDALHQRFEQLCLRGVGVLEQPLHAVGDLAQVVRRNVRRHSDGDTGRAVDQQVRNPRRQHHRLLRAAVVVRLEIDRLLVDVSHHLHRERSQPALGVAHRRGRVVARRAEVALPRNQRGAHHPRLREAYQRVVDRRVTMRVVLTHHVTDHTAALREAPIGPVAAVVHRVQHASVDGLEPVAYVGERPRHDHAHRVVDVRALHFDLQLDRLDTRIRLGVLGLCHVVCPLVMVLLGADMSRRPAHCAPGSIGVRYRGSEHPWHCAG